jgi:glycopeptide antibiotics resistance protein
VTTRQRYLTARIAYVAVVLLATLASLEFSPNLADASMRLVRALTPSLSWRDAIDGLRNAVLFAGFGAIWVMTSLTGKVVREIRVATLMSLVLSTTVEGLQVFSPVRMASILDVTTNTLGGFAGALVTAMLLVAVQKARRDRSYVGIPTLLIAGPYTLALVCEMLAPLFESNPVTGLEGGPFSRLAVMLQASTPLDWNEIPVVDIPLFVAGGMLLLALLRERRGASSMQWIGISIAGAVTAVAAHLAHGFFGLPVRWEAVTTDALSISLGAWAANRYLGRFTQAYRGSARARLVILSYMTLLVLWGWRPLFPETRWDAIMDEIRLEAFIPLSGLAARVDVFSALHVAQQSLLYLPLGALLAVWPLRLSGKWSSLWPALGLAVLIEFGHIVVAGRTLDVTNILLACAGLAMGWVAVRRSGYQPYGAALRDTTSRPSRRS